MNVSRETQEKLDVYLGLLRKWSPRINLVSSSSLKEAASRHFEDSLQLVELVDPNLTTWADLGSGGGFPGAVVAIVMSHTNPGAKITLVESDQRKATFLRTVSRETSTPFKVVAERLEVTQPLNADVVSARALAQLSELCSFAERHLGEGGKAYFLKGETWEQEVEEARKQWRFTCEAHKSVTNRNAAVLEIGDLSRA